MCVLVLNIQIIAIVEVVTNFKSP